METTKQLGFKIDKQLKKDYKKYCEAKGTTIKDNIADYITTIACEYLSKHKNLKQ